MWYSSSAAVVGGGEPSAAFDDDATSEVKPPERRATSVRISSRSASSAARSASNPKAGAEGAAGDAARGAPGGCYGPLVKQTNHKRHLVSACFALGSCAGCSNMPVRSLTRTRRRRRATGRVTKRGIRQERRPSLARRVGIAHSPAATARRREDRAPFASLSDWFEKQHRKARGCSQQTT